MAFLPKIIILLTGCNIILARSPYDYEYESYRPFHVPWAIKYPQPLISIDGAWPISYSYPVPKDIDYRYEEYKYQQELLANSLNKALIKVNQLLPPSSSNLQDTTTYPQSNKPEVLAEALNKAIDRLGVLLTRQPLPLNIPEVTTEVVNNRQPTMAPEKVSDSVSSAINDLNKLFATLPEELKANPNLTPLTNNNKPVFEFQPMRPAPFLSKPLLRPEPNVVNQILDKKDSATEEMLFTSNPLVEQNLLTEKVESTTTVPIIASSSGIPVRNSDDNDIFTTIVPIIETSTSVSPTENVDTTVLPTENNFVESTVLPTENNVGSTDLQIRDVETDVTTIRNDVSDTIPLIIPQIDIRFKADEPRTSDFIFPDEYDKVASQNKKPVVQPEIDLASRFQEQQGSTANFSPIMQSSTPITLEYKPSRPPFHPDVFPPPPSPRPESQPNLQTSTNFELGDRNKVTAPTQTQRPVQNNQNPQIVLEYKPSRPPFHPDVFPPVPTARPQIDSSTNFELGDRNKETAPTQTQRPVQNNQNPQIVLEYKPSRPPFHPDVFPPVPTARPQIDSSTNFELGDRNKPATVNNQQQTLSTVAKPDLADRNDVPVTTSSTTEFIFTTTQNNEPYHPTHYYSTPISLEYVPSRPFYAPHPIVYPRPIIPPGTPWPASSTERLKN